MLVDDSAVVRAMLRRVIETEPRIEIVATAGNGELAVSLAKSVQPDVIVLDIEMPVMDGITALPLLLATAPAARIVMASTLTTRNAEISIKAMTLGAADYVPKPTSPKDIAPEGDFQRELLSKILTLGSRARTFRPAQPVAAATAAATATTTAPAAASEGKGRPISLRRPGLSRPQILAIGSSTGGPQALLAVLKGLPAAFALPIVITQHMPATFTAVLADHLARGTGRPTKEAANGEIIQAGHAYVAPGAKHMLLDATPAGLRVRLTQDPPENFCRPSVDPMLRSLVAALGPRILCAILTGMGNDGLGGAGKVVEAGGTVIAQDEASSVVWGMPGAVANAGLCSAVLPLSAIAGQISQIASGGAP